jgi:hypothetical protein
MGVEPPLLYETVELGSATVGLAAGMRGGPKNGQHQNPSSKERWGLNVSHHSSPPLPRRGRGEVFFLTFSFIGFSFIG